MKVLVVDDQPEALKEIARALEGDQGPDKKPYEVVALADHEEAVKRLEAERFDVVVTDMRMGPEEDEGLEVVRKLMERSPITIVLTAYPSIPNCVAAMRAGAWDYIEKEPLDGSNAYERLLESVREACEFRRKFPWAGRADPNARWIHEHSDELIRDYPGEVVAVLDQGVVDHDEDSGKLRRRLTRKFPFAHPVTISIPDPHRAVV